MFCLREGFLEGRVSFSPDGKLLAGTDGRLLLWDLTAPEPTSLPAIEEKGLQFQSAGLPAG